MERQKNNPLPQFVGNEPETHYGDFLDGVMANIEQQTLREENDLARADKPIQRVSDSAEQEEIREVYDIA